MNRPLLVSMAGMLACLSACADVPANLQFRNQPQMATRQDMALVYFYRYSSQFGCALNMHVDELRQVDAQAQASPTDGQDQGTQSQEVAVLSNGSYTAVYMRPGKHTLYGTAAGHDKTYYLNTDLVAGETYYYRGSFYHPPDIVQTTGVVLFTRVNPAMANQEMAGLQKSDEDSGVLSNCL